MSDTQTGLPELPEGYFWRIKKGSPEYLRLQIRKKKWFGSVVIEWSVVTRREASPKEIRWTASNVLRRLEQRQTQGTAWKKYLGDYPPKTLPAEVKP